MRGHYYYYYVFIFSTRFESRTSEWMLEKRKQQVDSWRWAERGEFRLWQQMLSLQPQHTGVCVCVVLPCTLFTLSFESFVTSRLSFRTRVRSAALWRAGVIGTGVPDRTGIRSRCLALSGWTVQQGATFRYNNIMAYYSVMCFWMSINSELKLAVFVHINSFIYTDVSIITTFIWLRAS